ncbi:MAG: PRC-barrel domain containing protein [Oscillochloris sp.]|nr:PRC-barrel domain containing protein [Oscillochloris sp.]
MLRSTNDLRGFIIRATDGEIGSVDTFFFDDVHWSIRYMVVNTGGWLLPETVLIAPRSLCAVDWKQRLIAVNLTRQQVQDAPSTETDQPVSRQMEVAYATRYRHDPYWYGTKQWGETSLPSTGDAGDVDPAPGIVAPEDQRDVAQDLPIGDAHLRSTHEVAGYRIHARDGEIGHIDDFVMDDTTWAIRYLVVDTHNWWPGKKVLVAPTWISTVNWMDRTVEIGLSCAEIKAGPEYDPTQLNRAYERRLHRHFRKPSYWDEAPVKR